MFLIFPRRLWQWGYIYATSFSSLCKVHVRVKYIIKRNYVALYKILFA